MIDRGIGNNDRQNFQAWYVNILEALYENRAAGIAVLMISAPLLERYLRQKNGRSPAQELDDACMTTLYHIFPALVDAATARKFWNVYRNGFLHQATLNLETRSGSTLPPAALTHDIPDVIRVNSDGCDPQKLESEPDRGLRCHQCVLVMESSEYRVGARCILFSAPMARGRSGNRGTWGLGGAWTQRHVWPSSIVMLDPRRPAGKIRAKSVIASRW